MFFVNRSVSRLLFGSEQHHKSLRIRCCLEAAKNIEHYLDPAVLAKGMPHRLSGNIVERIASYSATYFPNDPRRTYINETMNMRSLGCYVGWWQFMQTASSVQQSLHSWFPEHMADFIRADFTHKFQPLVQSDKVLHDVFIMWTPMRFGKTRIPNHLVPLLKVQ